MHPAATALLRWYEANARSLPWRETRDPWAVLVSEVMLQQTQVDRVLPAYRDWLARWPTPAALAAAEPGEAVRAWGRLGYPRRALWLHRAATAIVARHGGQVPADVDALLALPGVGSYTARAVAAFAFGQRQPVVDTNVRRVHARLLLGTERAAPPAAARDHALAELLLPEDGATAARVGVATMELGALVCIARAPRCAECPLRPHCAWYVAGRPASTSPAGRSQRYEGTDRQARGALLAVLRGAPSAVSRAALDDAWPEPVQRARALDSLVSDGLVEPVGKRFRLPTG